MAATVAKGAILFDLGFFLPRYRALIEIHADPPHTPKEVAKNLWHTVHRRFRFYTCRQTSSPRRVGCGSRPTLECNHPSLREHMDGLKSVWPKPVTRGPEVSQSDETLPLPKPVIPAADVAQAGG